MLKGEMQVVIKAAYCESGCVRFSMRKRPRVENKDAGEESEGGEDWVKNKTQKLSSG